MVFFPMVWGSVVFLLEPINHRLGAKSLMRSWERGDLSPFVRLLLAGLVCGMFWESWNWLADARWTYNIPYLKRTQDFRHAPGRVPGLPTLCGGVLCVLCLGQPALGRAGLGVDDYQRTVRPMAPAWLRWLLGLGAVAYGLWMCRMIDLYLVKGWLP